MPKFVPVLLIFLVFAVLALFSAFYNGAFTSTSRDTTPTSTPTPIKRITPRATSTPSTINRSAPAQRVSAPGLSNSEIVSAVKQNPGVLDAAISKDGNTVSLVLIVHPLTNKNSAKQQGDNFVRLYKSLSNDDSPGRSIGRGKYDYLIGVYYPDETKVALGAKSRASDRITW